jgi:hypothetical protein
MTARMKSPAGCPGLAQTVSRKKERSGVQSACDELIDKKVQSSQANSGLYIGTTQGRPRHDLWTKLR